MPQKAPPNPSLFLTSANSIVNGQSHLNEEKRVRRNHVQWCVCLISSKVVIEILIFLESLVTDVCRKDKQSLASYLGFNQL